MVQQLYQLVYLVSNHTVELFPSLVFVYYFEGIEEYDHAEEDHKKKEDPPPDTVKVFPLIFSTHGAESIGFITIHIYILLSSFKESL